MRFVLPWAIVLAVSAFFGCTKDAAFPNPGAGTVLELGFDWLTPVGVCIDSDDHADLVCGTLEWLDGERLMLELDLVGMAGWTGGRPDVQIRQESQARP